MTDIVKEMNKLHPENTTTSQNISNKLTRGTLKYSEAKEIASIIGRNIEWGFCCKKLKNKQYHVTYNNQERKCIL